LLLLHSAEGRLHELLLRQWWKERPARKDAGVPLADGWLFPSRVGRGCLTTRQFARLFRATVAASGIKKPVTLHRVIQALLGHAMLTTTAGYNRPPSLSVN
jgi:site-specific recombinase XerD